MSLKAALSDEENKQHILIHALSVVFYVCMLIPQRNRGDVSFLEEFKVMSFLSGSMEILYLAKVGTVMTPRQWFPNFLYSLNSFIFRIVKVLYHLKG